MKKLKNIRIRTYRVGLGDCFLLTFTYGEEEKFHILIDCGVLLGTENVDQIMHDVASNIGAETNQNIDVVVVTHEHWDHLSGFKQAESIFRNIHFQDVWVAWTEHPDNPLANKLRKIRESRKKAIKNSLDKLGNELDNNFYLTDQQKAGRKAYLNAINEISNFGGGYGIDAGITTSTALDFIKNKAESDLIFCTPKSEPFPLKDIDGLRVYVLGPPEDEKLIKKEMSQKEVYQEMYMSGLGSSFLGAMGFDTDENLLSKYKPFDRYKGVNIEDPLAKNLFPDYDNQVNDWRKIDNDWMDFSGQLALALDNDTNNTSLVLAFELIDKGKFLIFPGDAQVGNWLSWYNYKWNVTNKDGVDELLDIRKIFERTVFYKVGHHGSHNATLSEKGLELMNDKDLSAMIPVDIKMAQKKKWKMPFEPLLENLNRHSLGRVLISDSNFELPQSRPNEISSFDWKKFTGAVECEDLYIDVTIEA